MSGAVFEVRGLNKSFGPTRANRNIDFRLKAGEVHGLIGENGSGKSTLISQIAGICTPDSGEMYIGGQPYAPRSPLDAYKHKISMVLQELGVVGTLPADVNVFLGRTGQFTRGGVVDRKALKRAAAGVFEKWGLPMPPLDASPGSMLIETRKMVELARALSVEPNILILDEITQSLSLNNRRLLHELLQKLKAMGRSVILITHDIDELIEITDAITVLRDGEVAGELISAETTPGEIRRRMVGRESGGELYRAGCQAEPSGKAVLSVRELAVEGELEDVSFDVHAGEILGFCGLSDSGIHAVGRAVFGLSRLRAGSVRLAEKNLEITSPMQALKNNMGYVPKDRDDEALMTAASIRENFALPSLGELAGFAGCVPPRRMNRLARDMVEKLSVKCTGISQPVSALSGGNRQKINLGRWLAKELKVLILDCPTRGVDVGVKANIYELMREAKRSGIAMILISDELTEAIGMSDRLIVMKGGRIAREIRRGGDMTERAVIEVMV